MNDTPAPHEAPLPDRRRGLVFFGVFFVLAGLLFAVADRWIAFGTTQAGGMPLGRVEAGRVGSSAVYAFVIVVLGVGSILARRWARALLLCGGGLACFGGALAFAEVCRSVLAGTLFHPVDSLNPAFESAVLLADAALICLGTPLAVVAFYWREDVWQTCVARDPRERWTDRCPLPVLACCILQSRTALGFLAAAVEGAPFAFFGGSLAGWPACGAQLLVFLFAAFSARAFYHRNILAWWAYTGVFLLLSLSSLFTRPHLHGATIFAIFDAVQLAYFLYARRFFSENP